MRIDSGAAQFYVRPFAVSHINDKGAMMMKRMLLLVALLVVAIPSIAHAQSGFNPEYLGNAQGADPGFCLKYFTSFFNEKAPSLYDFEVAFEPQYFMPGFTGDSKKDQIQFIAHLPIGYKRQTVGGVTGSVTGLGTLYANVEHFWLLIDTPDVKFWLDHGLSGSFPTATNNNGIRIGGNSYGASFFQEFFLKYGKLVASVSPVSVGWQFTDSKTNQRSGLSVGAANSAIGYQLLDNFALGVHLGASFGNLAGTQNGAGGTLPVSVRFYTGPAFNISIKDNLALQVSGIIDAVTRNMDRGQGIFTALWYHF